MSVFRQLKKASELLEYEKTLHRDLKVERWKEYVCIINVTLKTMLQKTNRTSWWNIIKIKSYELNMQLKLL